VRHESDGSSPLGPHIHVTCTRCGTFALARSVFDDLPEWFRLDPNRASRMSHTIRRMQRQGQLIIVHPNTVETYWETQLPTPSEQANELIQWIGNNQVGGAKAATERELALDAWIGAVLPTQPGNASGLRWLIGARSRILALRNSSSIDILKALLFAN
jgi:hypothetical protein